MVFKTLFAMLVSGYVSFGVSMMATGGFPQSDIGDNNTVLLGSVSDELLNDVDCLGT